MSPHGRMSASDDFADIAYVMHIDSMKEKHCNDRLRKVAKVKPEPEKAQ